MDMYDNIIPAAEHNLELDGMPFYISDYNIDEAIPRRELNTIDIASGTNFNSRGKYIAREGTFYTTVQIEKEHPDVHYKIFKKLSNKPVEVYCPLLGGIFKASVTINWEKDTPTTLRVVIKIKELPVQSEINGEENLENLDTETIKNGG